MAREVTPAATLGAYGAALFLVFLGALGVGRAVGPVAPTTDEPGNHRTGSTHSHSTGDADPSGSER